MEKDTLEELNSQNYCLLIAQGFDAYVLNFYMNKVRSEASHLYRAAY